MNGAWTFASASGRRRKRQTLSERAYRLGLFTQSPEI